MELKQIDKIIRHPVISSLITALIIVIVTNVLGLWPKISRSVQSVLLSLISSVSVPLWLLIILSMISLGVVLRVLIHVISSKSVEESWRNYTEDLFYGLRWRWKYYSDGSISTVIPFCIQCDFQIEPSFASNFRTIDRWEFRCENCGHMGKQIDESIDSFENRVQRQIQLKLRSGTWQEASNCA